CGSCSSFSRARRSPPALPRL
ncbi:MAG: hypothetical protein AVDCRST_MAG91-1844, partial [uncultured Sphingomonadaceae bacterium]